ncbi:MAG: hypothetical protein R6W67_05545 [Bacteroidales bacterium]
MQQKIIILFSILIVTVFSFKSFAQDQTLITGVVTTFKSIPLNNAKVSAARSGQTVFTDSAGNFAITAYPNDVLNISAAGFRDKRLRLKRDNVYVADLVYVDRRNNFNLAVQNGHVSEEALSRATQRGAGSSGKDYSIYKSIYELISSEIYNVRVQGTTIVNTRVRSFDSNPRVLLVVDEKIVNDISYINPDYVKYIEFIDDVRSSLYGAQGANGVIRITLK